MNGRDLDESRDVGFARGRTWRLAVKELRETLRDRRTLATLVLMPLLVYPLLGATVQMFLVQNLRQVEGPVISIAFDSEIGAKWFSPLFLRGEKLVADRKEAVQTATPNDRFTGLPPMDLLRGESASDESIQLFVVSNDDALEGVVREQQAHLGVRWKWVGKGDEEFDPDNIDASYRPQFEFIYERESPSSRYAFDHVSERFRAVNDSLLTRSFEQNGITEDPRVEMIETRVSAPGRETSLLSFVPLVLVLMTITGAVYPAIDLTAGERERGTMEILIAAPIPRISLLFGKFVAVVCVAMLTAAFNILAMFLTGVSLGLGPAFLGQVGFSWIVVPQIFALLFVFAAFFSAVLLGVTSFARSFKEAQAYLIPLMLFSLAPGLVSLMPDLKATPGLAVVPLVNIVLVARDLLVGNVQFGVFAMAILSTTFYGLMALAVAAHVFGTDPVLYGSAGTWKDLLRRPKEMQPAPTIHNALSCLAVLFPMFIVLGGLPAKFDTSMQRLLAANAALTIFLFLAIPLIFAHRGHSSLRTTFSLAKPRWASLVGAILIGSSMWAFVYEVEMFTLTSQRIERLRELFETIGAGLNEIPLGWKLACLAVAPAVCEEWFFRGYLLSAFRRNSNVIAAVVASAILFGLFHVVVREKLLIERLLPSTIMGLLLGWVCVRSRSLFPGMLLHLVHNGVLVTIAHYEMELKNRGFDIDNSQHLPAAWLLAALLPIGAGVLLLWRGARRESEPSQIAAG